MTMLRLLPFIYALLFILSRKIDVKVHKGDELTVKINFNIFAIILKEDKIKRNSIKNLSRMIKNAKHTYKALKYIISKSDVTYYRYAYPQYEDETFFALKSVYTYASEQFLISYLSINAKSFRLLERQNLPKSEADNSLFDINIHFSLLQLIISALLLLYYIVKNNIRRVLNNV